MNAGRERAGTQHHGKILRLLFCECARDLDVVADLIVNLRCLAYPVIEYDRQPFMQVITCELLESPAAIVAEMEVHVRASVFIATGLRVADIVSGNRRSPRYDVVFRLIGSSAIAG